MSTTPRPRSVLPALAGTGILLCGAGLTACGSDDDTAAVTVTPGGGDGNGGGSDDCSGLTAREAVDRWASEVPLPEEGHPYAPGAATLETYEPCAALSWMVLPVAHATASSPNQIMLFHHGGYTGTATSKVYGFTPT